MPLAQIGGKGLFIKEIEAALLTGQVDLAVHSLKDMPAEVPEGLSLGAVPPREECRDAFISSRYANLAEIPPGGRVGTGSLRRRVQVLHRRPDLEVVPLRGNVDTRLKKMESLGWTHSSWPRPGSTAWVWPISTAAACPPPTCCRPWARAPWDWKCAGRP